MTYLLPQLHQCRFFRRKDSPCLHSELLPSLLTGSAALMSISHRDTVLFIYAITFLFGAMAVLITLLPTVYSIFASFVAVTLILVGALKLGILKKEKETE
jgi:hypothetical protein